MFALSALTARHIIPSSSNFLIIFFITTGFSYTYFTNKQFNRRLFPDRSYLIQFNRMPASFRGTRGFILFVYSNNIIFDNCPQKAFDHISNSCGLTIKFTTSAFA